MSLDNEEKAISFVTLVDEVSLGDNELMLNVTKEISHRDLSVLYDSLFNVTCIVKLDNVELTKIVHRLNEMALICDDEDERDDLTTSLEAQVQELKISRERLLLQVHMLRANNEMYHEVNLKLSFELIEAMYKVDCLFLDVE
ncbi:hypothetical protein C1H46_000221 [Malus baccata]|uniref:Uncharacterized protein n=1 Tax=Malus baccata TaxID=106549 RepID=A0A540NTD8_MALBA|nr:hypothetical protein C1H46_000221 [Malus baccata]